MCKSAVDLPVVSERPLNPPDIKTLVLSLVVGPPEHSAISMDMFLQHGLPQVRSTSSRFSECMFARGSVDTLQCFLTRTPWMILPGNWKDTPLAFAERLLVSLDSLAALPSVIANGITIIVRFRVLRRDAISPTG